MKSSSAKRRAPQPNGVNKKGAVDLYGRPPLSLQPEPSFARPTTTAKRLAAAIVGGRRVLHVDVKLAGADLGERGRHGLLGICSFDERFDAVDELLRANARDIDEQILVPDLLEETVDVAE